MKYLKNLCMALLVLCLSVIGYGTTYAFDGNIEHITINGNAQQEVVPDTAYVYFSVIGRGENAKAAAADSAEKAVAVKKSLLGLALAGNDVETVNYYLNPVYDNKGKIIEYRANNDFKVKVTDLQKIGMVIDEVAAAGADSINNVEFTLSNKEVWLRQLLSAAVRDARKQADAIANAGGRAVGRMIGVRTSSFNNLGGVYNSVSLKRASADMTETVIEIKGVKLSANVEVTFALE